MDPMGMNAKFFSPEPNIEAAPQQQTRRLQVISDAQASKLTGRPVEQDASWRGDS